MADNVGTLVTAPIRPGSDLDTFPAFYADEGKGGWHAALTLAARDAIPTDRLGMGMRCWVESEQKVYRWDMNTHNWVLVPEGEDSLVTKLTYGENFATNECFRFQDGVIYKVTSLDTIAPWVDGITLEAGISGQPYPVATTVYKAYTTPLVIPPAPNRVLFLGQNGKITSTVPARSAGDVWLVRVARRNGDHQFTLSTGTPTRLS